MELSVNNYHLKNLGLVNVIMAKNGDGKSGLLREFDRQKNQITPEIEFIKYLSPERGGQLINDAGITNNTRNPVWVADTLRNNGVQNFRQISVANFNALELLILRKIAKDNNLGNISPLQFEKIVSQINGLLDNVKLVLMEDGGFEIQQKENSEKRTPETLSSGESELISIAIEILYFAYKVENAADSTKKSLLLLDEPNAHIHPDLQYRLISLLVEATKDKPIITIISTHDTAILGALSKKEGGCVSFMEKK